jgi:hypothetical protein
MIIRSVNGKPMALPPYGRFLAPPLNRVALFLVDNQNCNGATVASG